MIDNNLKIHISDRIYDKFLSETDKEKITLKIYKFAEELSQNHNNITSISKGFWTRPIISYPSRYKFRVSNKDRIIFEYGKDKNEIFFLDYCSHDSQIRKSKSIKNTFYFDEDTEIDKQVYVEDSEDAKIDAELQAAAFSFIEENNYQEALKCFAASGDAKNKKKVNFLIHTNYSNFKNDFLNSKFRSEINITPKTVIGLRKEDVIYILNRIYSEEHYILGPYIKVKYMNTVITVFLKEKTKNLKDYQDRLSDKIIELLKNTKENCQLFACLYYYNDNAPTRSMCYSVDLNDRSLSKKELISPIDSWRLGIKSESFMDSESMILNKKKIVDKNLDFIFDVK